MSEQEKYPPYDDRSFPDPRHLREEIGSWEGKKALSLMNIDISLRRVADSIDIRKELDAKTEECKKLNEELARLRVNCDMYADARDKAEELKQMLMDGVKLLQRDLAAAERCIEELHAKMTTFDIPDRQRLIEIETIIRKYREEKDKEESWRRSRFRIGDIIAYRSLEPHKPDWVSWEVGDIDGDGFLYEAGKSVEERDNIHRDCAFLVKAAEDNR